MLELLGLRPQGKYGGDEGEEVKKETHDGAKLKLFSIRNCRSMCMISAECHGHLTHIQYSTMVQDPVRVQLPHPKVNYGRQEGKKKGNSSR